MRSRKQKLLCIYVLLGLFISGASVSDTLSEQDGYSQEVATYVNIAHAVFEDSFTMATQLEQSISTLVQEPSEANLLSARQAWLNTRRIYQKSEALRFGNPIADEFDARLNAWPLDESLLDYVVNDEIDLFNDAPTTINLIGSTQVNYAGELIDTSEITADLLVHTIHELGGNEAHVALGFHAIEFLLWGQDTNGTGQGAGSRLYSDFDAYNCTNGNCDRRAQYLAVVTDILLKDLEEARDAWAPNGRARRSLVEVDSQLALSRILKGFGSLTFGELAGERMKLGLLLNDPEEEHDCFSDNTHNSHFYNVQGLSNFFYGSYVGIDGRLVEGPSVYDLVKQVRPELARSIDHDFREVEQAFWALKNRGDFVERYDQMLAVGNVDGAAVIENGIEKLTELSKGFEEIIVSLDLQALVFVGPQTLQ